MDVAVGVFVLPHLAIGYRTFMTHALDQRLFPDSWGTRTGPGPALMGRIGKHRLSQLGGYLCQRTMKGRV